MKFLLVSLALISAAAFLCACSKESPPSPRESAERPAPKPDAAASGTPAKETAPDAPLPKSEDEWRAKLTPEQFHVLREKGTERAFTGKFWNNHEDGTYRCSGCAQPLFGADTKFDSGTGWPSFWKPLNDACVAEDRDTSHGMTRTEVHCSRCGGHLGHVFEDGPKPTGLRYCINSVSLEFEPKPKD